MAQIILARHGECEANRDHVLCGRIDSPLTDKGLLEAWDLGEKIRREKFAVQLVLSSRLIRAKNTASSVARKLRVCHEILTSLVERDHGILEGKSCSDIPKLATKWHENFGHTYVDECEGGENYEALWNRAHIALADIKEKIREFEITGAVLVVSHGALMRAMITAHKGLPWEEVNNFQSFSNCEFVVLE